MVCAKKGQSQIDQLVPLVIGLVAIGVVLTVGFLIFAEAQVFTEERLVTTDVWNESVTWSNGTFVALKGGNLDLGCYYVYNASGDLLIGSGNYTCNKDGINVSVLGGSNFHTAINVSYWYKMPDVAFNATRSVQNATASIPGWLSIIVIAFIGALLIGLVALFRRRQ